MYGFVTRHATDIALQTGKITSPTRSREIMLQKTKEFIDMFEPFVKEGIVTEKTLIVFDETIIGDEVARPRVIAKRRKSRDKTANVSRKRAKSLGSYMLFSTADGSTPFRVFVIREKTCRNVMNIEYPIVPTKEKGLRDTPHRVFVSSETGYISTDLFKRIMDEFIVWWTVTRPGLECVLLSDNLPIHRNKGIVDNARSHGIHMLNIMAGSSHWFQVHDQLPFAGLKNCLKSQFYDCFRSFRLNL